MAKIPDRYYVSLKGKMYPLYEGVLVTAEQAGLRCLETSIIQIPTEENGQMAIVIATATFDGPDGRDRVFTDVGDCSPKNCSPMIATAALRMASTRAKGRVLRDGIGLGQTLAEELPGNDHQEETTSGRRGDNGAAGPPLAAAGTAAARPDRPLVRYEPGSAGETAREVVADESAVPKFCSAEGCGLELTGGQGKLSLRLFGRGLCPACQAKARKQQAA